MKVTAITKFWTISPLLEDDDGAWLLLHKMQKCQTEEERKYGRFSEIMESYPLPEYTVGKIEVAYEDYVEFMYTHDRYYQLQVSITAPTPEECNKEMKKFLQGKRFKGNFIRVNDWGARALITDEGNLSDSDILWQEFTIEAYPSIKDFKGFRVYGKTDPSKKFSTEYDLTISSEDILNSSDSLLGFDYGQYSSLSAFLEEVLVKDHKSEEDCDELDDWTSFREDMQMLVWDRLIEQLTGYNLGDFYFYYESEIKDDEENHNTPSLSGALQSKNIERNSMANNHSSFTVSKDFTDKVKVHTYSINPYLIEEIYKRTPKIDKEIKESVPVLGYFYEIVEDTISSTSYSYKCYFYHSINNIKVLVHGRLSDTPVFDEVKKNIEDALVREMNRKWHHDEEQEMNDRMNNHYPIELLLHEITK